MDEGVEVVEQDEEENNGRGRVEVWVEMGRGLISILMLGGEWILITDKDFLSAFPGYNSALRSSRTDGARRIGLDEEEGGKKKVSSLRKH